MGFGITIVDSSGVSSHFDLARADVKLVVLTMDRVPDATKSIATFLSEKAARTGWQTIRADALLGHVQKVRAALQREWAKLPYVYHFVVNMPGVPTMSCAGVSFHIGKEGFALRGDLGECVLEKYSSLRPDGTREVVESRDARKMREIDTSDAGKITIRKRKKSTGPLDTLARIEELLAQMPAEESVTTGSG